MKLKEIINYLQEWAPLSLQESYDNSGLIVGDAGMEVNGALICLDSTEEVIDEAIEKGINLVIAHHPIVFKGLKKFNGKDYVERVVMKAIKNDIALYAIHTNLDNVFTGVNAMISDRLGLSNLQILALKSDTIMKYRVYVPQTHLEQVVDAVLSVGGKIGNYEECSFQWGGTGTFKALDGAQPFAGEVGERHEEREVAVEAVVNTWQVGKLLSAVRDAHPYEEVAYDLWSVTQKNKDIGAGLVGDLEEELTPQAFFDRLKSQLDVQVVRHTQLLSNSVKRIAVCGGSGSFLLGAAKGAGADVFVTADFKYHQFFDAEKDIVIADIGHYESEHHVMQWIQAKLNQKFANFAVRLTEKNTNPVHYY